MYVRRDDMATSRKWSSETGTASEPPRGRIRQFAAGAAIIALVIFAFYAVSWRVIASLPRAYGFSGIFCDFKIYYYPMGEAIFGTGLPVEGFLYSVSIAILLAVFPPLGLTVSLVLWGVIQALFVFLLLLLFRRLVPAGLPIQLLFVALVLSSFPVLLNFLGGQVSVFMIVFLLGAFILVERGRRAAAAGLLALAVSFKFFPVIFLAPFAVRRDIRFLLLGIAACVVFLFVFPGLLLGVGDTVGFYSALMGSFIDSGWVTANPHSQFFPHVFIRMADLMGREAHTHLALLRWVAYGVAAANMGLIFLVHRARLRHTDLWSYNIVFLTVPFVFKTSWVHDFVYLSFTQAFLAWRLLEDWKTASDVETAARGSRAASWREWVRRTRWVALILLLAISIVISNNVFYLLFDSPLRYGLYGFLFWANLLLLLMSYVMLLPPALQRFREPSSCGADTAV